MVWAFIVLTAGPTIGASETPAAPEPAPVVWRLDGFTEVGGHRPSVLGGPKIVDTPWGKALRFDGHADGLIVPAAPIGGWPAFTIEVFFKPDPSGETEQRFLHLQDARGQRALIELRLDADSRWCLDTFLFDGDTRRLTLIDRAKLHPTDRWHWAALTYDGRLMTHFVDGVKECEGEIQFGPMEASRARTSVGVRLNQVHWFKGAIREVRFTAGALAAEKLQRASPAPAP